MPELTACPSCGRHSLRAETGCPHCGNCTKAGRTVAAALVGLALAGGCGDSSDKNPDVEPAYGVVASDSGNPEDTGDTGED
jgi:hypothetical protein